MILGVCMVHRTLLIEESASASALDSCTVQETSIVETDKGDVPIRKEYFQLWYMQGTPYALYDNYAYVTL